MEEITGRFLKQFIERIFEESVEHRCNFWRLHRRKDEFPKKVYQKNYQKFKKKNVNKLPKQSSEAINKKLWYHGKLQNESLFVEKKIQRSIEGFAEGISKHISQKLVNQVPM